MILKYGSYAHDASETWWDISARFTFNPMGRPRSVINRWTIWGTKVQLDGDQGALTTQINLLEAAYSDHGKDLVIYENDGSTPTQHFLLNAGSIDGVQVKDISYLAVDPRYGQSGVEYLFKRTYRIIVEAELVADDAFALTSWEERVVGIGNGGPIFIMKGALTGPPQPQIIQQQSSFRTIQMGRAVGYLGYPGFIATPIWPQYEHLERRQVIPETPRFGPVRNVDFPISWRYEFESSSALVGQPTFI
jgi:hypothetical protein